MTPIENQHSSQSEMLANHATFAERESEREKGRHPYLLASF